MAVSALAWKAAEHYRGVKVHRSTAYHSSAPLYRPRQRQHTHTHTPPHSSSHRTTRNTQQTPTHTHTTTPHTTTTPEKQLIAIFPTPLLVLVFKSDYLTPLKIQWFVEHGA